VDAMASRERSRQGFQNSNLNGAPMGGRGPSSGGRGQGGPRHGMVMLGSAKARPRQATAVGGKLSVPKPINLPSMKKEHGGNDPTTNLVASGTAAGGWKKDDKEEESIPAPSMLTSQSTWASPAVEASALTGNGAPPGGPAAGSARDGPPPFVGAPYGGGPPRPGAGYRTGPASSRPLNPRDFPTLAGAAHAAQAPAPTPADNDQRRWSDDERQVPSSGGGRHEWCALVDP